MMLVDLRRQIAPMAPGTPVTAEWWSERIAALSAYRNPRFQTLVLTGFGLLAMGLMGIGIYAVISFLVVARIRAIPVSAWRSVRNRARSWHMVRQAGRPASSASLPDSWR